LEDHYTYGPSVAKVWGNWGQVTQVTTVIKLTYGMEWTV